VFDARLMLDEEIGELDRLQTEAAQGGLSFTTQREGASGGPSLEICPL
jgi:hypothetical protein